MSFPIAFFEASPLPAVAAIVTAPFVAKPNPLTAYGGGFFVKPGSRTLKPTDLTKPFMFEWATLGMKLANGATKKAPDMSIFEAVSKYDFALKKQIVSGASNTEKKALVNAFGSMKLPLTAAELAEIEKQLGLAKTVEKRVKKFVNIEEEKELADYKAAHKDMATALRQAGLKAIRDKHRPPAKAAVGGATSADTVDTASEAEMSDEDLAEEATQEQVDKVARALKKLHGEIGEPPYHIDKVLALIEKDKVIKKDLIIIARELKIPLPPKPTKYGLKELLKKYMEGE